MAINTRTEFKDYCFRRLGFPTIEIHVTDEQANDRIDEAITLWNERHYDGSYENLFKYQITQADIDNQYIILPDEVRNVEQLLPLSRRNTIAGMFNIEYQLHLNDIFDLKAVGSLINYVQTKQYLAFIDDIMNGRNRISFSLHSNKLFIHLDWGTEVKVDDWIILACHMNVNPDVDAGAWNDNWLKRYATALIKQQNAEVLTKFVGLELLGGVTMDGSTKMAESLQEIEKLEEELTDRYDNPPGIFIG